MADSTLTEQRRPGRGPATRVSLSRVGVTGVEKIIRVCGSQGGSESLYHANLECFVDLNPEQAGVHMSRFEEVVNEAIDSVVLGEALRAEGLPRTSPSRSASARRDARRGPDRRPLPRDGPRPVSGLPTQELYTLFGTAVASERGTRTLTGVEAQGMTACPCARVWSRTAPGSGWSSRASIPKRSTASSRRSPSRPTTSAGSAPSRRPARGIGGRRRRPPTASHRRDLDVERDLRADEARRRARGGGEAHANPRFVEDCVREMIRQVTEAFPTCRNGAFIHARQENLETIHRHNVVAERYGLLSEIAEELASGEHSHHHTTMREWLEEPSGLAT